MTIAPRTINVLIGKLIDFATFEYLNSYDLGKAEVECGENTIEVVFLTESVFQGRIYVVGHSNDERCVSRDTGRQTTSITVRKDQCGVAITRSVSSFIIA
uniref:ZP domain-containing protein n=2 Tax=Wuchereria bancrofti TaxID=6293 RepID=A0A1I8EZE6_WUCBA